MKEENKNVKERELTEDQIDFRRFFLNISFIGPGL